MNNMDILLEYAKKFDEKKRREILNKDKSYDTFYHFSKMRESLFNWYPFNPEGTLLEVGGENGALTGLFCKKCKNVTTIVTSKMQRDIMRKRCEKYNNLNIHIDNINELKIEEKYDYIVIVGQLEYMGHGYKGIEVYIEIMKSIMDALTENGIILIATENRYGLRYFCGEREPIINKPFAGINRYIDGSEGYMLSRNELVTIMDSITNVKYKFYYPLPDYKFPQLIYTDKYLPKNNLKERLVTYSKDASTLVMSEKRLYDDIVENEVFPFFSNSFLIECTINGQLSDVMYAALSTDRGLEHGFATILSQNDYVEKIALEQEGEQSLDKLIDNIKDIEMHGVNVIPHCKLNNRIRMPLCVFPTLSECLKIEIKKNVNEFVYLFDVLYEEILKSSELVDLRKSECYLLNSNPEYWGPILKNAYIDMIPINCFWDGKKLMFFDQEFVINNFPVGYIMFRAIKYTYQFITFADAIYPIEKMKKKYNLEKKWSYYQEVEKKFVDSNRDMEIYGEFWNWSKIDNKMLKENMNKLIGEYEG